MHHVTANIRAGADFASLPFYHHTVQMLECVSTHNFDQLAQLCDDDFGIIDLDTQGKNVVVANRQEWENWFHHLFAKLDAMQATTSSDILNYQALQTAEMGYSVLNFCQHLTVGEGQLVGKFYCVATIIWKKAGDHWVESRWHCSLIRTEPENLLAAAA
jgi:SnoaL-like domain